MPRLGGALDIVQVSDPATPVAGRQYLYFKSDGQLYTKKPDGAVVQVGTGGGSTTVTTQASTYTAVSGNVVLASGTFTVTVPVIGQVTVKNIGVGTITVAPASGLIDGAATFPLSTQYASVTVIGDSTNVWVI